MSGVQCRMKIRRTIGYLARYDPRKQTIKLPPIVEPWLP